LSPTSGVAVTRGQRVVQSVDYRLPEKHNHSLEFSENNEVVEQKRTAYEKYLERPGDLEGVPYFEFLEQ
jgi:hypothetical protein